MIVFVYKILVIEYCKIIATQHEYHYQSEDKNGKSVTEMFW